MNILMALSQLEVTGAEVYATTISNELISRGNKVFIVSDTLTCTTQAEYTKIEFNKRSFLERIKHIKKLYSLIKKNDIHIVHAHSRASSWSCEIACKLTGIPLITTTHGKQPVHLSRKIFKAFGKHSICVCENIAEHLEKDLNLNHTKISVIRNPINFSEQKISTLKSEKTISIIGRLSGPKGDVAYDILEILEKKNLLKEFKIKIIGGKNIPDRFLKFKEKEIEFLGYIDNIQEEILKSSIVIGAGRVAMEAILNKIPTIAIGEAEYIGYLKSDNINKALSSNFGDISNSKYPEFDEKIILKDIYSSLLQSDNEKEILFNIVFNEINLRDIVDKIEKKYFELYVDKKNYEIPVLMYHRVINSKNNEGVHGTYIYENIFREHLKYLKDNNYETLTFKDLNKISWRNRFKKNKKYIFLTFDDGYVDNYEIAFPILKEYEFKATIFLMAESTFNEWDVKDSNEKIFPLMSNEMIKEMQTYGIEFGAHTFNHPKINKISKEEIEYQITESKKVLENKIGEEIITFAYPYGILNSYAKEVAKKAGYTFALATDSGPVCLSSDLFQIRRIAIFPNTNLFSFKRKISGSYNFKKIKRENKKVVTI